MVFAGHVGFRGEALASRVYGFRGLGFGVFSEQGLC